MGVSSEDPPKDVLVVTFKGAEIRVYASRHTPNTLVVDIDTSDLEDRFVHLNGSPRLRVFVNEECSNSLPNGGWEIIP
jgi:hypothetical protein